MVRTGTIHYYLDIYKMVYTTAHETNTFNKQTIMRQAHQNYNSLIT